LRIDRIGAIDEPVVKGAFQQVKTDRRASCLTALIAKGGDRVRGL
jgi:hypothetical protein